METALLLFKQSAEHRSCQADKSFSSGKNLLYDPAVNETLKQFDSASSEITDHLKIGSLANLQRTATARNAECRGATDRDHAKKFCRGEVGRECVQGVTNLVPEGEGIIAGQRISSKRKRYAMLFEEGNRGKTYVKALVAAWTDCDADAALLKYQCIGRCHMDAMYRQCCRREHPVAVKQFG